MAQGEAAAQGCGAHGRQVDGNGIEGQGSGPEGFVDGFFGCPQAQKREQVEVGWVGRVGPGGLVARGEDVVWAYQSGGHAAELFAGGFDVDAEDCAMGSQGYGGCGGAMAYGDFGGWACGVF